MFRERESKILQSTLRETEMPHSDPILRRVYSVTQTPSFRSNGQWVFGRVLSTDFLQVTYVPNTDSQVP